MQKEAIIQLREHPTFFVSSFERKNGNTIGPKSIHFILRDRVEDQIFEIVGGEIHIEGRLSATSYPVLTGASPDHPVYASFVIDVDREGTKVTRIELRKKDASIIEYI
jgi:hypothetical protein